MSCINLTGAIAINTVNLNPYQKEALLEVITASLNVTRRTHLFSLLQGSFQALIPHEIMVCGVRMSEDDHIEFDHFSSTRYFTDQHLEEATLPEQGVIWRAMSAWSKSHKPIFLADGLEKGEFAIHSVPFEEPEGGLQQAELKNMAAYGVVGHAGVASFFCFSRVSVSLDMELAHLLQLLTPHLHVMMSRLVPGWNKTFQANEVDYKPITSREAEILQWVHEGKTNQNIADTLQISALTVKNHVQSILRKLNVLNRSHAAVKALSLGLIKPTKSRGKSQKKQKLSTKVYADVRISAALLNPESVDYNHNLVAQSYSDDGSMIADGHTRQKTKKKISAKKLNKSEKNTSDKNNSMLVAHLTDAKNSNDDTQRLMTLTEHNAILANAAVINEVVVNSPLSEAERLEQMRIEERDKRRDRIAARRKSLIAKGLLKSQRGRNSQTT